MVLIDWGTDDEQRDSPESWGPTRTRSAARRRRRLAKRGWSGSRRSVRGGGNHGDKCSKAQAELRSEVIRLTSQTDPSRRFRIVGGLGWGGGRRVPACRRSPCLPATLWAKTEESREG